MAGRQSARVSKITTAYPGLARDALQLYPYSNSGRQMVKAPRDRFESSNMLSSDWNTPVLLFRNEFNC